MAVHPRGSMSGFSLVAMMAAGLCAGHASAQAGPAANAVPVAQEFERLHFRSIGPATMSGRISDFAVYEKNPAIYYVGTAHGGVWKTTSNGAMYTPLFQDQGLIAIGDVTMSQTNPDLLWVGTGESNNRQSTSWGDGVYRSTDGGKTFAFMGLRDSKHINRIVIDPTNDNVVLVAATGPLFGPGGERGIYKTTDGGQTWKQVLRVDEETGANDLVMSPTNPRVLYASTYQRLRTACCMNGGGPGSGIWKSTDGGDTWARLSGNGLPAGSLGRIGLDAYRKDGNIVYASIEGPTSQPNQGNDDDAEDEHGGMGGPFVADEWFARGASSALLQDASATGLYRSDDGGATWRKLNNNNPRPMYFSQVRIDPNNADRVYMGGVGLQLTIDAGKTFATDAALVTHDDVHAIWIDPSNSDHVMIGNDGGVSVSYDGSKTWTFHENLPVGLFYHVSYDMETPYNVCGGMQDNYDWCGPSVSRMGRGIMNYDWFQIDGGDGFVAIPDLRDSRIIYTETQDGSIIRRNKVTGEAKSIRPSAQNVVPAPPTPETYRFHWDTPMILSPNDPGVLLVGANRLFKSTDRGDSWTAISPDLTKNQDRDTVVTMGLAGKDIRISKDDGIVSYSTLISIAESSKQPGLYYTGSDDGVVSMSRDGGKTWTNITSRMPGFPKDGFVSEIVPSRFDAGTVYITVDNHRLNDYGTHIWVSNDFGQTFRSLNANLSTEIAKTLTEDLKNPDVLYLGTETGIMVSLDRGVSWRRLKANLPTVRVDEITLHPRDNAMLVATHGRALWILDHLEPIQQYTATTRAASARLFDIPSALQWKSKDDRNDEFWGHAFWTGENPPFDAVIQYYLPNAVDSLHVVVSDASGKRVRDLAVPAARNAAGIQTVCWDERVDGIPQPPGTGPTGGGRGQGGPGGGRAGGQQANIPGVPTPLPTVGYMPQNPCGGGGGNGFGGGGAAAGPYVMPGTYNVALVSAGKVLDTKPLRITMDPQVPFASADRRKYQDIVMDLHALQREGTTTMGELAALNPQMVNAASKIRDNASVPADAKAHFDALNKSFEDLRTRFGVSATAGLPQQPGANQGRGGGPGGGGAFNRANVLGRTSSLKNAIMSLWEMPSASMMAQYADVKKELPKAIADANAFLNRAASVANELKPYGIEISVTRK